MKWHLLSIMVAPIRSLKREVQTLDEGSWYCFDLIEDGSW